MVVEHRVGVHAVVNDGGIQGVVNVGVYGDVVYGRCWKVHCTKDMN